MSPKVESAIQAVADQASPALDRGRTAAAEHGSHLAGVLADHIPTAVVDRLPDNVVDHLPISRPRRGRKFLILGLVAGLVGAGVVASRRARGSAPAQHRTAVPPRPTDVADLGGSADATPSSAAPDDAAGLVDPTDPRVSSRKD
ncbi:MAG: hypothetical protein NTX33_05815 [Propionibacteriales bacterium]|nr:hypothetical protein [Propionibacteriales bacterium]